MRKGGVQRVVGEQCTYGLKSWDGEKRGAARKNTKFMTNSPRITTALKDKCPTTRSNTIHEHVGLIARRTKAAQIYPPELCQAICKGFKEQLEANRQGHFMLAELNNEKSDNGMDMTRETEKIKNQMPTADEDVEEEMMTTWDDVTGAELNPKAIKATRAEEIAYVRKTGLYAKVPIKECLMKTGIQPINTRWIDINKGDTANPNYRSKLIAREINTHKRDELSATTPPVEALKIILSMIACYNKRKTVMINDISRAFFHTKAKRGGVRANTTGRFTIR